MTSQCTLPRKVPRTRGPDPWTCEVPGCAKQQSVPKRNAVATKPRRSCCLGKDPMMVEPEGKSGLADVHLWHVCIEESVAVVNAHY